jgi:hypothetical protein
LLEAAAVALILDGVQLAAAVVVVIEQLITLQQHLEHLTQ